MNLKQYNMKIVYEYSHLGGRQILQAKLTLWKVLNKVKMENGAVVAYNHLKVLTLFGKPFYLFY
ncbi:MAG: hypothetical protein LBE72_02910, partial [Rickettsia sp.]|nr:hypothetical protein [Rickettsia sp.]